MSKLKEFASPSLPVVGVYEDKEDMVLAEEVFDEVYPVQMEESEPLKHGSVVDFIIDDSFIDLDNEQHAERTNVNNNK